MKISLLQSMRIVTQILSIEERMSLAQISNSLANVGIYLENQSLLRVVNGLVENGVMVRILDRFVPAKVYRRR